MHARKQTVRERPFHYFSINLAIVEAKYGESNEEAWRATWSSIPRIVGEREDLQPRQHDPALELRRRNPAGGWQRVK